MRYRIDQEQLSEFLVRQVRLVERLPVEAAEAAAEGAIRNPCKFAMERAGIEPATSGLQSRRGVPADPLGIP